MFARVTLLGGVFRYGSLDVAWNKKRAHKSINWPINIAKQENTHEEARHRPTAAADPVQVALCGLFGHKEQNHGAAIERRHGKKVERAQQQIQREEDEQSSGSEITLAGDGVGMKPSQSGS